MAEGSKGDEVWLARAAPRRLWQLLPWRYFPWRLLPWLRLPWQIWTKSQADNIGMLAAGIAFYAFLAAFPAIVALVAVYGLIFDPSDVEAQLAGLHEIMPPEAFAILYGQIKAVVAQGQRSLSLGLLASLLFAIWSATKGMRALMTALNVAYVEAEQRGFLRASLVSYLFTLGGILFAAAAMAAIAALPLAIDFLDLPPELADRLLWLRWALLAVALLLGLALLYHFGPNRRGVRFRWLSAGAVTAALLWIAASVGFSAYVANFGDYNEIFGSLGAVVILLFWLYFSAYAFCLGAEVNAVLEGRRR